MRKRELRWWIVSLCTIFVVLALINVARQEGGFRYYLYSLDWAEVLGTIFVAGIGTILLVWQISVLIGFLFIIALLIALSRTGRLRNHASAIVLFIAAVMVPCALLWNMTRQHLPRLAGLSLVVFWVLAPVVLYLCIRHVIIRRREPWSVKDRRIAYTAATLTLLIGSLSFGTFKSDAEVEHSLNKGHDIVNAVKHYYTVHRKLPESLDTLVPVYFASVPETDVPEGWGGHEAFVYQASGERSFSVTFESASYATCNYERTEDSWDCH